MAMRRIACCVALCLLAGCGDERSPSGPAAARPAWLDQPPQSVGLIHGVGVVNGVNQRDAAIAKAREDLASQIAVSIQAERAQDDRLSESLVQGGARSGRLDSDVRSQVRTKVDQQELPGVSTVQVWTGNLETAALVVLDRTAWGLALRQHLADLDLQLQAMAEQRPPAGKLAAAIAFFRKASPVGEDRAETARRLRVAAPAGSIAAPPLDLAELRAALAKEAAAVSIALTAGGDASALVGPAGERLAQAGLAVVDASKAPRLILTLTATSAVRTVNGDHRVDGHLDAALTAKDGRKLAGFSLDDRASGTVLDEARRRLRERQAEHLASHVMANLYDWLTALGD